MIFNSAIQYAILAMTYLGKQEVGKLSAIREIAGSTNIPLPYLAKIISRLSRRRLVLAKRGPSGGVMLGKPASQITIEEIVHAMEGTLGTNQCVLGLPDCNEKAPCPVHDRWKSIRELLYQELHQQTVSDLARIERPVYLKRKPM